jgi:hypothetical protein
LTGIGHLKSFSVLGTQNRGKGTRVFEETLTAKKKFFEANRRFPHSGIKIVDNSFPFLRPLNSMKKGILLYCMCLCALLSFAQGESTKIPPAGFTTADSALFITDLSSVVSNNSKVIINWKNSNQFSPEFVVVERSSGGGDFEMVAALKQPIQGTSFEWTDDAPAKGRNLYRIRFDGDDGQPYYSKIVSALIAGDISFRFYPNPVDNILILRSEGALDVQVLDATGKVRLSLNRLQGIQTINVSSLEKGFYYLRINNRSTGVITQEKLVKN